MTKPIRDLAVSIRQRLANIAKERHRPAAELLQYFAMERFLYRLAQSPHRERFVLKGAMMLVAWRAPAIRPTMDIDLLGRGRNRTPDLVEIVQDLCRMDIAPPDGLVFDPDSVVGEQITVESEVAEGHGELATQVVAVRAFLGPVLASLVDGAPFAKQWPKGGPWQ